MFEDVNLGKIEVSEPKNSIYTHRFWLESFGAKSFADKNIKGFKNVQEKIELSNQKKWKKALSIHKTDDMFMARIRTLKKSGMETLQKYKDDLNDKENRNIYYASWFNQVRQGFALMRENMHGVMSEMTGQDWFKVEFVVANGQQCKVIEVVAPREIAQSEIFTKPQNFENVITLSNGENLSLYNYFQGLIQSKQLIILGEKGDNSIDRNTIILQDGFIYNLPALSLPINNADIETLNLLARGFDSAKQELSYTQNFNSENEGNYYFEVYPEMEKFLESAMKFAKKNGMLPDDVELLREKYELNEKRYQKEVKKFEKNFEEFTASVYPQALEMQ